MQQKMQSSPTASAVLPLVKQGKQNVMMHSFGSVKHPKKGKLQLFSISPSALAEGTVLVPSAALLEGCVVVAAVAISHLFCYAL